MKRYSRILVLGMVICLMLCIGIWNVPKEKIIAAETVEQYENIYLETDATSLNIGDELTVKLYAKNLKVATLTGALVYDKDVFEEFSAKDFVSPSYLKTPWNVTYSRQTGGFVLCNSEGEYIPFGNDCILEMRFTVKKAVSSSTIKILGIELDNMPDYIEAGDISVTVGKQSDILTTSQPSTDSEDKTDTTEKTTNATTTHVKNYTEVAEGFYFDYNYTQPASKGAIEIYVNGAKDYKSAALYTDMTPCYVYSEDKGKIKSSISKIVVAVTSSDTEPTITKGKIKTTKADTNIAKAKIKNGYITVTAGKNGGNGYLWVANVIEQDKAKKMISIPVNVKMAPTKIETYSIADKNITFGTTSQYSAGELQLIERTYVYLYPYAKVNNANTETTDSISFTATVDKNAKDYIKVEKTDDPFVFAVEGCALKDGKETSGNVIFTCNQSGKKVKFKAIVKDKILDFTYQLQDSEKLVKTTADSATEAYRVIGVSTAAITTKLDVKNRTFYERGRDTYGVLPTTDRVYLTKISKDTAATLSKSVRDYDDANDGIDVSVKKNGKPNVKADTTKGVTASYGKGVITVKVAKKTKVGTTAYFLLSTNSGYGEIIAVTTAEK